MSTESSRNSNPEIDPTSRTWRVPGPDREAAQQPLEATPPALVQEARRLADDLCRHWEATGEQPCVQDVVGWLPESVVSDLWSLANAVEEAWRDNLEERKAAEARSLDALVEHAQRLLRRIHRVLKVRFSHVEPLEAGLLDPPSESPFDNHQLGALADALEQYLDMADTFNDELSEQERLGPHWLEEGREVQRLLVREIRPDPDRASGQRRAARLQTLAVRLQSLVLLARRAATDYSVSVGFTPDTEPPGTGHPGSGSGAPDEPANRS